MKDVILDLGRNVARLQQEFSLTSGLEKDLTAEGSKRLDKVIINLSASEKLLRKHLLEEASNENKRAGNNLVFASRVRDFMDKFLPLG